MSSAIPDQPGRDLPGGTPPPAPPGPAPSASASAGRAWILPGVVGLIAGLVVGVLVGVLLLGGSTGVGSADRDAALACEYVASVSEDFDAETIGLEDPVMWRLQAIGPLAMAAAKADATYETFGEQGMDVWDGVSRLDTELIESSLEALRESCDSF